MTFTQLMIMFALFGIVVTRAVLMRKSALEHKPSHTTTFTGGWMVLCCMILYPFFDDLAKSAYGVFVEHPYLILFGFLKGFVLWLVQSMGQALRVKSNSSTEYRIFMAVMLVAFWNGFLGEQLTSGQWAGVVSLFVIGCYFCFKGHFSELSLDLKVKFLVSVLLASFLGAIDQVFLTETNWFAYLFLSGLAMFVVSSAVSVRKLSEYKELFFTKTAVQVGAYFAFTEAFILFVFVAYIPVTLGFVAMAVAAPCVMVMSALLWGEGDWKKQFAIGLLSFLAVLPIVLGL